MLAVNDRHRGQPRGQRVQRSMGWLFLLTLFFSLLFSPLPAWSDRIYVAVASNFKKNLVHLATRFEKESGHSVIISSGSSGKLYSQISHGAPFQLFLSADLKRPQALLKAGFALPDSLFTYAQGHLVLWSPDPHLFSNGSEPLTKATLQRIALGNPRSVPYGSAAQETLLSLGLWQTYQGQMVFGENVGQVLAFVMSGNVDAGFVALSQVMDHQGTLQPGSYWDVPPHLYSPLMQGGVQIKQSVDPEPADTLVQFLRSPTIQNTLTGLGYRSP